MTDAATGPGMHVRAREFEDLAADDRVPERLRTRIAGLLSDGVAHVVFCPAWVAEDPDKAIRWVKGSATERGRLAVGRVESYSAKAWRLRQPTADEAAFLPKSQITVFETAPGVETIDSPQRGLGAFQS